jgi:hypothetical protein
MLNEVKNDTSHSSLRPSKSGKKEKVSFKSSSCKEKTADKPRWLLLKLLRGDSMKGGSKKIFDERMKMGKVAFQERNYNLADSYISRSFILYHSMNKLGEDHKWVIDANKDGTDVDAAIVMGDRESFLC